MKQRLSDSVEDWLPIPGYEGRYEVSDQGGVRAVFARGGQPPPREFHPATKLGGYKIVNLAGRVWMVHQLVLLAFGGPRPDGWHTRHLDGDPANNRLENLRYGTASENAFDRVRHGRDFNKTKSECPSGHPFDEENTRISPKGVRICRTCWRLLARKRRAASA